MKLKTESREQQSPEDRAGGNLPGREPEGLEDPPAYYWPQKQAGTLLCMTNQDVWSVRVSVYVLFPLSCFSCSYVILIACFIDYLISPFPPPLALPVPGGLPAVALPCQLTSQPSYTLSIWSFSHVFSPPLIYITSSGWGTSP